MSDNLVSVREFARRDGCDEARVRRGVQRGELPTRDDRLLPASLAGTAWRAGNRCPVVEGAPSPAPAPARKAKSAIRKDAGSPLTLAEAYRRREIALARLKRHELGLKSAEWVDRAEMATGWAGVLALVGARLLKIPAEAAPLIATCPRVGAVQAVLTDTVYAALTDLTGYTMPLPLIRTGSEPPVMDDSSKIEAEAEKVTAQGRIRALEVSIAHGGLIAVDEAEEQLARAISVARGRILAIAGSLPPRLFGRTADEVETALRVTVVQAIEELEVASRFMPTDQTSSTKHQRTAGGWKRAS